MTSPPSYQTGKSHGGIRVNSECRCQSCLGILAVGEGPALVQGHPGDRWSRSTPKALGGPPTLPPHTPQSQLSTLQPHRTGCSGVCASALAVSSEVRFLSPASTFPCILPNPGHPWIPFFPVSVLPERSELRLHAASSSLSVHWSVFSSRLEVP